MLHTGEFYGQKTHQKKTIQMSFPTSKSLIPKIGKKILILLRSLNLFNFLLNY